MDIQICDTEIYKNFRRNDTDKKIFFHEYLNLVKLINDLNRLLDNIEKKMSF